MPVVHALHPAAHGPSFAWTLAEPYRAALETCYSTLAGCFMPAPAAGDGHPVLVLPGFIADDQATGTLRSFLTRAGYDAHSWNLGRNLGSCSVGADGHLLSSRIEAIAQSTGRKVSLIGWSLGGLMARQGARLHPHAVRQVITLGSPFMGNARGTAGWQFFEMLTGHSVSSQAAQQELDMLRLPLPVPSTAIYSRTDGVVKWSDCMQPVGDFAENVEVSSSHWGLPAHTDVLAVIADRLAQPEDAWRPF